MDWLASYLLALLALLMAGASPAGRYLPAPGTLFHLFRRPHLVRRLHGLAFEAGEGSPSFSERWTQSALTTRGPGILTAVAEARQGPGVGSSSQSQTDGEDIAQRPGQSGPVDPGLEGRATGQYFFLAAGLVALAGMSWALHLLLGMLF